MLQKVYLKTILALKYFLFHKVFQKFFPKIVACSEIYFLSLIIKKDDEAKLSAFANKYLVQKLFCFRKRLQKQPEEELLPFYCG